MQYWQHWYCILTASQIAVSRRSIRLPRPHFGIVPPRTIDTKSNNYITKYGVRTKQDVPSLFYRIRSVTAIVATQNKIFFNIRRSARIQFGFNPGLREFFALALSEVLIAISYHGI